MIRYLKTLKILLLNYSYQTQILLELLKKDIKNAALFFWDKLVTNNQICLSKYKGWYSIKDESFYQEKELEKINNEFYTSDGEKVEWIEEESYFFKLSNWENKLLDYYKKTQISLCQTQEEMK